MTKRSTAQKGSIPLSKTMNLEFDLANDIWTRVMFFHLSKNQRLATVRAVKPEREEAIVSLDQPHPSNEGQGFHESSPLKPHHEALISLMPSMEEEF